MIALITIQISNARRFLPRLGLVVAVVCLSGVRLFAAPPSIHWKLDETSGSVATDASGNGIDGEYVRGASPTAGPAWMPNGGLIGGAVQFDNIDDETIRSVAIPPSLQGEGFQPFTIALWVKTTSTANDTVAVFNNPIDPATGEETRGDVYYALQVAEGVPRATARNGESGFDADQLDSGIAVNDNQWHHLAVTFSSKSKRQIWVDSFRLGTDMDPVEHFMPVKFAIGALDRDNIVEEFDGLIDDVAVWDSVLTQDEFVALSALGQVRSGTAADLDPFLDAFRQQGAVTLGNVTWEYAAGLPGFYGDFGGSLAGGDAYIVLDNAGNGMRISGPPPTPVITEFDASPTTVFGGENVTLEWTISNATSATIEPGLGAVDPAAGSLVVTPEKTITYTLTAMNENGSSVEVAPAITVLPPPPDIPPLSLRLHWSLDEGIGTAATDAAGNHDGTFVLLGQDLLPPPTWTPGLTGAALQFAGINGVSVRTKNLLLTDYPFSIAGWVNATMTGNDTFAILGTGFDGIYYTLGIFDGSSQLVARNDTFFRLTGPNIADGNWHFVTGVFQHRARRSLYVDGALTGESTTDAGEFVVPDRFAIGAQDRTDTSIVDAFAGTIDDVSVWRGVLTPRDVAILYSAATGLGLNAGETAILLAGFEEQETAYVRGLSWEYRESLGGSLGAAAGSLQAGNASIVMDDQGNGMLFTGNRPLQFLNVSYVHPAGSNPVFRLSWQSEPGESYSLFATDNLMAPVDSWSSVADSVQSGGTSTSYLLTVDPAASEMFFRVSRDP